MHVDYAITGAVAVSYYGTPRTTQDADLMIHISTDRVKGFLQGLQSLGLHVDMEKLTRQLASGYNILTVTDTHSPYIADLIIVADATEKRLGTIQGIRAYFQSPESLILSKLRMIKATVPAERSQKDRDDIRSILAATKVDKTGVTARAKQESTLAIFRELSE